jgi:hypothetical protein
MLMRQAGAVGLRLPPPKDLGLLQNVPQFKALPNINQAQFVVSSMNGIIRQGCFIVFKSSIIILHQNLSSHFGHSLALLIIFGIVDFNY